MAAGRIPLAALAVFLYVAVFYGAFKPARGEVTSCSSTTCEHGTCEGGVCVCAACYTGGSCNHYVNPSNPFFETGFVNVKVPDFVKKGATVHRVYADDDDEADCTPGGSCLCGNVVYDIISGNEDGSVSLDRDMGTIILSYYKEKLSNKMLRLNISAQNELGGQPAYTVVQLEFPESGYSQIIETNIDHLMPGTFDGDNSIHHRSKRATVGQPDNVTFTMEQLINTTFLSTGEKINFRVTIGFPNAMTDMQVELLAPENETLMMICDATITHVGAALESTAGPLDLIEPTFYSSDGVNYPFDHLVYLLGNVSHKASHVSYSTDAESQIVVEFSAVMLDSPKTVNNTDYWISAGVEFSEESEIIIGQCSFTSLIETALPTYGDMDLSVNGTCEVGLGEIAVVTVDLYLPDLVYHTLVIDAFGPANATQFMHVCTAQLSSAGANYQCVEDAHLEEAINYPDPDPDIQDSYRTQLSLPSLYNSGARYGMNSTEDARVSVSIFLRAMDRPDLLGKSVDVGATLQDTNGGSMGVAVHTITFGANTTTNMTEWPSLTTEMVTPRNRTAGQMVSLIINMSLPKNSESDYIMEVISPFNNASEALMSVCNVTLLYKGQSVPCGPMTKPQFMTRNSTDAFAPPDYVYWNLGRLINPGYRTTRGDPNADVLSFQVFATMTHANDVAGETAQLVVGMTYSDTSVWVSSSVITVAEPQNITFDSTTAPTFTVTNMIGDHHVPLGGTFGMSVIIEPKPGISYSPNLFEIVLPFNYSEPAVTICDIRVSHVGSNIPCFNATNFLGRMNYTYGKENNTGAYLATSYINNLCNFRVNESAPVTEDDEIHLDLIFKLEQNHTEMINGTFEWSSVALQYDHKRIWIAQLATQAWDDYAAPEVQFVSAIVPSDAWVTTHQHPKKESTMFVANGVSLVLDLYYFVPPMSRYLLDMEVLTDHPDTDVCSFRFESYGNKMPCIDEIPEVNITRTTHSIGYANHSIVANYLNENLTQDLSMLTDNLYGNSVLKYFAIIGLKDTFSDGDTIKLSMNRNEGGISTLQDVLDIIVAANATASGGYMRANFSYNYAPADLNANQKASYNVSAGQTTKVRFEFSMPNQAGGSGKVVFRAADGYGSLVSIAGAVLVYVGGNFPCLQPSWESKEINVVGDQLLPGTAQFEFASLAQYPLNSLAIDPDANKVIVDAFVHMVKNDTLLLEGSTVMVTAEHWLQNQTISLENVTLTIKEKDTKWDAKPPADLLQKVVLAKLNCTGNFTQVRIRENVTLPLTFSVPPNSAAKVEVSAWIMIGSKTAFMRVVDMRVQSAGYHYYMEPQTTTTSVGSPDFSTLQQANTTQDNSANLDLGWITNNGLLYNNGSNVVEDDEILVEIDLEMMDPLEAENGTVFYVNLGVDMGSSFVVLSKAFETERVGTEEPVMIDEFTNMNQSVVLDMSNSIMFKSTVFHDWTSTAEAYNVTLRYYTPEFVNVSVVGTNEVLAAYEWSNVKGWEIVVDRVLFTDVFEVIFEVMLVDKDFDESGQFNSTLAVEVAYDMIPRPNTPNATFFNEMHDQIYEINTPLCDRALGVAKAGGIETCSINNIRGLYQDQDINSLSGTGWFTLKAAAQPYDPFLRSLDFHFGNVTRITEIEFSISSLNWANGKSLTGVQVMNSLDGQAFNLLEFIPFTMSSASIMVRLQSGSLEAQFRHLRLMFNSTTDPDAEIDVRLEFFGCVRTSDDADGCFPRSPVADMSRSVLVTFNANFDQIYVCGPVSSDTPEIKRGCQYGTRLQTTPPGTNWLWTPMDYRIHNVLGFRMYVLDSSQCVYASSNTIFGQKAFLKSCEQPATGVDTSWTVIPQSDVDKDVPQTTYYNGTSIDLVERPSFVNINAQTSGFTMTYEGIMDQAGVQFLSWAACCS